MRNNNNFLKWIILAAGIITACIAFYFISMNMVFGDSTKTKATPKSSSQSCKIIHPTPLFKPEPINKKIISNSSKKNDYEKTA